MAQMFRGFPDVMRHPLGDGAELLYGLLARQAHVATAARVRVLLSSGSLATLDRHTARIANGLRIDAASVRADLDELVRAGLLLSADELVRRIRETPRRNPPRIESVGIPTRYRPESVRGALDSYIQDAVTHGRDLEYVVVDGSTSAEEGAPLFAVVEETRARHAVPISYLGHVEKARFAEKLASVAGVPLEVARFGLLGHAEIPDATGGNHNTLLLYGAGTTSLHVDDDTRCRLVAPPDPLPGLAFTSADDPSELWPVPDEPRWVAPGRAFVALHEDLLGRSVGECAAGSTDGLDIDGTTAMFFRRIEGRGGHIVVTQSGGIGDSGTGSMAHLLLLEGRSRARFMADEATHVRVREARQVVRVAPRASVGDGGACMSMGLGVDGRAILPPFAPSLRNGEGVFATQIRRCHHDALLGFVPWAVEHIPPIRRSEHADAIASGFTSTIANDLLRLLIVASRVEPDLEDPGRSLRALGDVLVRWGSLPRVDFEEIVRIQVIRSRSLEAALFGEALRRHGRSPAFWARDVDRVAAALRAALPTPEIARASDLTAAFGVERGRVVFQELVRRHGELLCAWPDLWSAAVELRGAGFRIAV